MQQALTLIDIKTRASAPPNLYIPELKSNL